jgi:hypothetical protein
VEPVNPVHRRVVMAVLTLPALRQLKPTTLSSAPTFFT